MSDHGSSTDAVKALGVGIASLGHLIDPEAVSSAAGWVAFPRRDCHRRVAAPVAPSPLPDSRAPGTCSLAAPVDPSLGAIAAPLARRQRETRAEGERGARQEPDSRELAQTLANCRLRRLLQNPNDFRRLLPDAEEEDRPPRLRMVDRPSRARLDRPARSTPRRPMPTKRPQPRCRHQREPPVSCMQRPKGSVPSTLLLQIGVK